jgi:hypothetical protein
MRSLLAIVLSALPFLARAAVDEDGYAGQLGFEFRKKQLAQQQAVSKPKVCHALTSLHPRVQYCS